MMKHSGSLLLGITVAVFGLVAVSSATQVTQSELGVQVWLDDMPAVAYRASVQGDWLVVEATHEPGWHTYSMDNVVRAREKTGKKRPETELPTVITPLDGVTIRGDWRQSEPVDLSAPDIRWYTWGFEGRSFFAARVDNAAALSSVQIDGQACTAALCAMVEALVVPVDSIETAGSRLVDPESLVVVARDVESSSDR
jgi:hypothetical protein